MKAPSKLNAAIIGTILTIVLVLIDIKVYTTTGKSRLAEATTAITSIIRLHKIPLFKKETIKDEIDDLHSQVQSLIKKIDEHEKEYHPSKKNLTNNINKNLSNNSNKNLQNNSNKKLASPTVKDISFTGDVKKAVDAAIGDSLKEVVKNHKEKEIRKNLKELQKNDPIVEIRKFDNFNAFMDYGIKKSQNRVSEINDEDASEIKHIRLSQVDEFMKNNGNKNEVERQLAMQSSLNSFNSKLTPTITPKPQFSGKPILPGINSIPIIDKTVVNVDLKENNKQNEKISEKQENLIKAAKSLVRKIDRAANKLDRATKKLEEQSNINNFKKIEKSNDNKNFIKLNNNSMKSNENNNSIKLDDNKNFIKLNNNSMKSNENNNSIKLDDNKNFINLDDNKNSINSNENKNKNSDIKAIKTNNSIKIEKSKINLNNDLNPIIKSDKIKVKKETQFISEKDEKEAEKIAEEISKEIIKQNLQNTINEEFQLKNNNESENFLNNNESELKNNKIITKSESSNNKESLKSENKLSIEEPKNLVEEINNKRFDKVSNIIEKSNSIEKIIPEVIPKEATSFTEDLFKGMDFEEPESKIDNLNKEIKSMKESKKLLKEIEASGIKTPTKPERIEGPYPLN